MADDTPAVPLEVIARLTEFTRGHEDWESLTAWEPCEATVGDLRAVLRVAAIVTEQQMFPLRVVVGGTTDGMTGAER